MTYSQPALAILAAVLICFLSLPSGKERRWVLLATLEIGAGAGLLVILGDTGTITKYLADYNRLTASAIFAMAAGAFTAGYLACFHEWRRAIGPLAVGLYFAGDVTANALYRRTEYVYDFQRMLQSAVHMWHVVVFAGVVIVGMREKEK